MKVVCIDDHCRLGGDPHEDGSIALRRARPDERYLVSLTIGKTYEVLSQEGGMYRIVDDTDDDYLFPIELFRVVEP